MAALSRGSRTGRRTAAGVVAIAACLSLADGRALALAPEKQLGQFAVEHWRVKDGLPGDSVVALAQATDGQLWIATLGGLAHYDGIRFTRAASPADSRLAPLDVRRLLAGADGIDLGRLALLRSPALPRRPARRCRSRLARRTERPRLGPGRARRDLGGHRFGTGAHLRWAGAGGAAPLGSGR